MELITSEFDISDAGGIALLTQICHAQDRVTEPSDQIALDGAVVHVKGVPKAHSAMRDELADRASIVSGLTKVGIALETLIPVSWSVRPVGNPYRDELQQ
jgi:hypothetical protein